MNIMKNASTLLAALLVTLASAAYADTGSQAPTAPTTGQGAATTVSTNPAATESKGKADKGLSTAEQNISKPHGKINSKAHHHSRRGSLHSGSMERVDHPTRVERPSLPERPGR
jgi:hypothetical protein